MNGSERSETSSTDEDSVPIGILVKTLQERRRALGGLPLDDRLVSAHLSAVLGDPGPSNGLLKRVGDGRFLAVGLLGTVGIGLLGGFLTHPVALALPLWKLKRLLYLDREWRPHLLTLYIQLEGGEARVFEAVHALNTKAVVVNYASLEARDFRDAFGTEAPSADDIISEVADLPEESVSKILASLVTREILRCDGSSYWIAF